MYYSLSRNKEPVKAGVGMIGIIIALGIGVVSWMIFKSPKKYKPKSSRRVTPKPLP